MSSEFGENTGAERIVFSGHVQGVGFRYAVRAIARHCPVNGYVRNLSDGTVEVVAQGTTPAISELIAAIQDRFRGNILRIQRDPIAPEEYWTGFDIRF